MDPESGERFTVKRYESEKDEADDGTWRHVRVTPRSANPGFGPVEITCTDEMDVRVVAEFVALVV